MSFDEDVLFECVNAVSHFLLRQKLVRQTIIDLGLAPEEVVELGPQSWIRKNISQSGTWGKNEEWRYMLHGIGCRLTNQNDGEPINWDCHNTNPFEFDPYFFLDHLEWRLNNGEAFKGIRRFISSQSDDLYALLPFIQMIQDNPAQFLQSSVEE